MIEPAVGSLARRSALLIGALAMLNYWPMLLGKVPFPAHIVTQFPPWESVRGPDFQMPKVAEMGDLVTELYPWKAFTRRAIASGTLPLWNPFLLMGAPFVGDPQTALFYPPNLLYYFLPTPLAWSLSFLVRTVLAGLLAALLARALGATRTAALTSGVIFAFCGWVTAFQTRPHLDTSLWLPLVFLAVDRLQRHPERSSMALVGVAFALPVLAGQPENAAHVTLAGLAFFLYRLAWPFAPSEASIGRRVRFSGLFAAAGILALGLAAVQMLPALEWIGQLERGFGLPFGPKPLHEIGAFLSRDLGATPNSAGVAIPESAAYAGMLALLVAPLSLLHRNRRDAIFFAALVACALQIVYGRGPVYWLCLHTPILRSIPNGRFLVVADLGLAVLAGLGLSALDEALAAGRRLGRAWWWLAGAALGISGIGVALILARANADSHAARSLSFAALRGPLSSAAMLLAVAALLAFALAGRLRGPRFGTLALAFVALDLVTASYGYIPFVSPRDIFPPAPTFRFLKEAATPGPYRVASVDLTYGSNFELMYDIETAAGYTVPLRRATMLLATLGPKSDATSLQAEKIIGSPNRLLDLMNVKYLAANAWNGSAETLASRPDRFRLAFSDGSVRVFENLSVLPRAFLIPASNVVILPEERDQVIRLCSADFNPAQAVILPERPPPPQNERSGNRPLVAEVTDIEQHIHGVRMRVGVAEPSILVLSQMHYPGWKALVDGREAPILRADYAFLGVAVGEGTHAVRFVYSPTTLRIGIALSGVSFLVFLVLSSFRRRTPGSVESPTLPLPSNRSKRSRRASQSTTPHPR